MKRHFSACVLVLLLLGCGSSVFAQDRELVELRTHYGPAPSTWGEAIEAAQVVARVRLLDRQYRIAQSGNVLTQYTAEVLEYFKAQGAGSLTLQVYRQGGIKKEADGRAVKYSIRGYPDFLVGEEYLLFLDWNAAVAAFATRGPNLAFRLDRESNRVYTSGKSEFALRQNERTIASMMAHVRTASR